VARNLRDVRDSCRFNARSDCNLDVVVTNETANILLSNGSNIVSCISVQYLWKYGFAKYSDNLYAACIHTPFSEYVHRAFWINVHLINTFKSNSDQDSGTSLIRYTKVKQFHYKPRQAHRVPGGWGSKISRQSAHEDSKFISLTHRPPLPPRNYSWCSFLLEAESTPGHSAVGRIMSIKFPVTPSGIELATFRLVAQCLNQLRNRLPQFATNTKKYILLSRVPKFSRTLESHVKILRSRRLTWSTLYVPHW
jgi:hypothetical protein